MCDNRDVQIYVSIVIPWANAGKGEIYSFREIIPRLLVEDALAPLPRKQEMSPYTELRTREHQMKRQRMIDNIAGSIASALAYAITKQDPIDDSSKEA